MELDIDKKIYFPKKLIFLGISCTVVFMIVSIWSFYSERLAIQSFFQKDIKLRNLTGKIIHYDEILTMSARLTAATKDLQWQVRYDKFEPLLGEAIEAAILSSPLILREQLAKKTDAANTKLVALEKKAFSFVSEDKTKEAQEILFGQEYQAQKKIYSEGMLSFISGLDNLQKASRESIILNSQIDLSIIVTLAFILLFTLVKIHSLLREWRSYLLNVNRSLDEQVKKRTKELEYEREKVVHSSKLAAIGEMSGQIAHEMNTPLGAITLTAASLKKKVISGKFSESLFESQLDLIVKVAEKLSRIIDSVRKLSKGEDSEGYVGVNIVTLIEDATLLCEGNLKKHSIDLEVLYELDKATDVSCHSTEISQVLINLFNNSIDAAKTSPTENRWLKIIITENNGQVYVKTTDSGDGIPEDIQKKIFEPRFSTKSLSDGTGFGLALSKQIIQQHGGELRLDTESENTTFIFNLPVSKTG